MITAIWKKFVSVVTHFKKEENDPKNENLASAKAKKYMLPKDILGQEGEEIATKYLLDNGFRIIDRNKRLPSCEIDIIAFDQAESKLVFIEVKTRTSDSFADPRRAVDSKRQRKMQSANREYRAMINWQGKPTRFDIVVVVAPYESNRHIHHYRNAFVPKKHKNVVYINDIR